PESVVDSLIDAWATGSSQAIDDIRSWLSERRNTTIASMKFRRASDSGFARVVLAYAPHNPTPNESELINRAISQRKLERELEALAPFARQARLRSAVSETGFDFDLAPEAERSTSSSDDWSVIEMVLDGKYDDVADGVHQGQLGPTPSAVVARAVELKLSTFGAPNVKNTSQNNAYVRLEWNWPGWFGANAVVVEVIDQSGSVLQSKVVPRNDGGIIRVDKSFFPKEELLLRLRFACLPPVGDHIASPVLTLFPIGLGLREKAVPNVMTGSEAPEPTRVDQPRVTVAVNDGNSGERHDGVTPVRPLIIVQPPIEITPETPPIGGKSSFFGRILNFFTRRR
ncbi:hypothetical protein EBT31_20945, partial [bacterium]|nr:hypothetical protein [bacterium]